MVENKERFRIRFGSNLIKNLGHVAFHLSDKEKELLINEFLYIAKCKLADAQWMNFQQFIRSNEHSFLIILFLVLLCLTAPILNLE